MGGRVGSSPLISALLATAHGALWGQTGMGQRRHTPGDLAEIVQARQKNVAVTLR